MLNYVHYHPCKLNFLEEDQLRKDYLMTSFQLTFLLRLLNYIMFFPLKNQIHTPAANFILFYFYSFIYLLKSIQLFFM